MDHRCMNAFLRRPRDEVCSESGFLVEKAAGFSNSIV